MSLTFNVVFSRDNFPRIKDGAYVINIDDKQSKGTLWISWFIDWYTAVYFDSLGIEYIPQEMLTKIEGKSLTVYLEYRIDDFILWGFYCIAVMEYIQFIFSEWL